jgi:hypothetical protein
MEKISSSEVIAKEFYRPFERREGLLNEKEMWTWIGKKVFVDQIYSQHISYSSEPIYTVHKKWEIKTPEKYIEGKIVGFRNIQSGYVERDYGYGPIFHRLTNHFAIQVIANPRQNPKLVPYEGIVVK